MDFQMIADSYHDMTCILAVEKKYDGGYGEIRIAACNQKYVDYIAHQAYETVSAATEGGRLCVIPDTPYDRYVPKDPNFEEICYKAAVQKESVHTYLHPNKHEQWYNVFVLPLTYEDEKRCYCIYTLKPTDVHNIQFSTSTTCDDVVKTCIKLYGADDFKTTMNEVIRETRLLCGAEVCTIMLMDFSVGTCSVLATSIRENSTIKRVTQFVNFFDIANTWLDTVGEGDCIIIQSEKDMQYICRVNHEWWVTLDEAGVDSVVLFPLRYNHDVLGFIWATNFDTRNTLRIKETLELTTYFISSHIAGYKMMKRLEHLGFTDILTGVMNRNAMNNLVSEIVDGTTPLSLPFGVIFADLNGLKTVNDSEGHTAGDLLLKKAAIILEELFDKKSIYRAGGDEFVIFLFGCSNSVFQQKLQALKDRSGINAGVCFAVGSCFSEERRDIRDVLRLADESMYADKERFYSEHPERKQR